MEKTYRFTASCLVCCAICAATAALSSCKFEQEDYFPESASLRISHFNEQMQDRLVAQSLEGKNGWVMQYFVAGTDEKNFEGFNIFARFHDNGTVTLASNHRFLRNGNANKYTEDNSYYEMLSEEGPVLSFNTWNDVLTVLVDPVNPSTLYPDGEGMNGDHNLVYVSRDDSTFTFRGERHGAETRIIPCDRPWEEYIEAVTKTKNDITSDIISSYYVINGLDTMYFDGLRKGYFVYCDRMGSDPLVSRAHSCVFTPNGFRMHRVDTLGTSKFREFHVAPDSTCLLSENDSVRVIATWDHFLVSRLSKDDYVYKLDNNMFTEEQNRLFDELSEAFKSVNANYSLESIGLGYPVGSVKFQALVLTFYTSKTKTKKNMQKAALEMSIKRTGYGKFELASDEQSRTNNNMDKINTKSNTIETLTRQFAATVNGVYNVIPDNYFKPNGFVFEPTEDKEGKVRGTRLALMISE